MTQALIFIILKTGIKVNKITVLNTKFVYVLDSCYNNRCTARIYDQYRKRKGSTMKYIDLGGSGLSASAIALGCMRIPEMSVSEVSTLINKCLELGVNFFDHADIYGGGVCEELFGKVFKEEKTLRDKLLLQSKCGIRKGYFDFSKEHILDSAEGILRRLGIECLDVLLLHRPDTLMEPDEVAEVFNILHDSGKVRYFGVSNMKPEQIELVQGAVKQKLIINQLQFSATNTGMVDSGLYVNMEVNQSIDRDGSILEYCRRKNITIQTWSSLMYGFFEGTFLENEKFPKLNEVLDRISKEKGITKASLAIAWILRHPAKMQAIPGTTKYSRIADMVKGVDIELSKPEWYEIYTAAGNKLP